MNFKFLGDTNASRPCRCSHKTLLILSSLVFISSGSSSSAFTLHDGPDALSEAGNVNLVHGSAVENGPPSTVADTCLPLLKAIRHTPSEAVTDRNQRSAGKAAVLGFVFGVRFALSPHKTKATNKSGSGYRNNASFEIWSPQGDGLANDRSALAISAYRQCQKEKALKSLNDFRWAR